MSDNWESRYKALVALLDAEDGAGIYPMGHLSEKQREGGFKDTDAYKCGWNDAQIDVSKRMANVMQQANEGLSDDVSMLLASGNCFLDGETGVLSINMNDTWAWALAWCPEIPPDQVKEVARLFRRYGNAGLMYWHSTQESGMRSEFHDNNRMIDFVAREESIRKEIPDSSRRAYHKATYTIGPSEAVTQQRSEK